ncbi:MAG: hypothetical protein FJ040_03295 [Chloroflexi bacterium]|nr:hypothetical protein [Chloroflexota bacterium]
MHQYFIRVWYACLIIGVIILVVAPLTFLATSVLDEVRERVNGNQNSVEIPRADTIAIPFTVDNESVALGSDQQPTLAIGAQHACVVTRSALLLCWGDNQFNQLGIGVDGDNVAFQSSPSPVVGMTDVLSVALGRNHSCALRFQIGEIWCWGDNQFRQLGTERNGPQTVRSIAARVSLVPQSQQIVAGANHTCALTQQGEVWCWGDNEFAQIALEPSLQGVQPQKVPNLPTDVVMLRAGANHTCALTTQGQLWCWGDNSQNQILASNEQIVVTPLQVFVGQSVSQFGVARDSTCAITSDARLQCIGKVFPAYQDALDLVDVASLEFQSSPLGLQCFVAQQRTIRCWNDTSVVLDEQLPGLARVSSGAQFECVLVRAGLVQCRGDNSFGQLASALPQASSTEFEYITLGSTGHLMSAGYGHVCAIWQLGNVICWGRNYEGQVGTPLQNAQHAIAVPHELEIDGVIDVVVSGNHSCVLRYDHTVHCWGDNSVGQLGIGNALSQHDASPVAQLADVQQIALGIAHTCALMRDGRVACWGDNQFGQVTGSDAAAILPVIVPQAQNVVKLVAGGNTTCALQSSGVVMCWGASIGDVPAFSPITQINDVVDLAVGVAHACAIQTSGDVYCWGDHHYNASIAAQFVKIASIPKARIVTAGTHHTCVLDIQQDVWCWGLNTVGQVNGESTPTQLTQPELQFRGTSHVVAGHDFTCARKQIGTISCWGNNRYAQLGGDSEYIRFNTLASVNAGFVMSSGGTHSCVLLIGSITRCWGGNEYGQLGDATTNTSPFPQTVRNNESFVAIDAGLAHTCAIVSDATVRCWGHNNFGQLGNLTNENANAPVIAAVQDVTKLALGNSHTCALLRDGGGACWGRNEDGQLGVGGTAHSATPLRVANLSAAIDISSGANHVCAVLAEGTVWCWGSNQYAQIGIGEAGPGISIPTQVPGIENAIAIGLGDHHTCAVLSDRTVWCWGWTNFGQAGGETIGEQAIILKPQRVSGLSDIVQLEVGGNHSCALTQSAEAICWGDNFNGQLGNGSTDEPIRVVPRIVSGGNRFFRLAAGGAHTCGLVQDGDVLCWGWNKLGQVGNGSYGVTTDVVLPSPVVALNQISTIYVGANHVCTTSMRGRVLCWGANTTGQIGSGQFSDSTGIATPQNVNLVVPALAVTVGAEHSCALLNTTELSCWGNNLYGQIGNGFAGEIAHTAIPNFVSTLIGVSYFASGANNNCAIVNGEVFCWGDNQYAQVGQPTAGVGDIRALPTKIALLSDMRAVTVGKHHACALSNTGSVYCWGRNNQLQLGGFVGEQSATPSVVQNVANIIQISAGDDHTCALSSQGRVYCWGSNGAGQLGSQSSDSAFVEVQGVDNIQQIALGSAHTCAFNGTSVVCWGSNEHGQLGVGEVTEPVTLPDNRTSIQIDGQVLQIAAGGNRSCVITAQNGEVWCWGQNENAQLGVTNNPDIAAPVAVNQLWSMQAYPRIPGVATPIPTARLPIPTATAIATQVPVPTATLIRPESP